MKYLKQLILLMIFFPGSMFGQNVIKKVVIKFRADLLSRVGTGFNPGNSRLNLLIRTYNPGGPSRIIPEVMALQKKSVESSFSQYYSLNIPVENVGETISLLRNDPNIIYADTLKFFRVERFEEDPLLINQLWLTQIRAVEAWQVEKGSSSVIVGVLDTGIDYNHPDLVNKIWVNSSEDLNGNGRLDAEDINGIDDDGNGYIDDVIGWDFTDAPAFPDDKDFIEEDNDPYDEHGHGTAMAGVIGAEQDNGIGISGVAPGVRIMPLRAGTSKGFLEEDDVARAVIYAVNNGVRIINMSFGDATFSLLFRDVLQYAYRNGVILVSSSGNGGGALPHFPSGFNETISVGSVNSSNGLSGFSNTGNSVDLVAPGQNVLTTRKNDRYSGISGTSVSTAIVSGTAALVVSKYPSITPDEFKSIITGYASDLGGPGWDPLYGAGLLDVFASVSAEPGVSAFLAAKVTENNGSGLGIVFEGSVFGSKMASYSLFAGAGEDTEDWTELATGKTNQVSNDIIGVFDIPALVGDIYYARMEILSTEGVITERRSRVEFSSESPNITNFNYFHIWDADVKAFQVNFNTEKNSLGELHYRRTGESEYTIVNDVGPSKSHAFLISTKGIPKNIEWFAKAESTSGKSIDINNNGDSFNVKLEGTGNALVDSKYSSSGIPSGILLDKFTDLNGNGNKEVIILSKNIDQSFSGIDIYEWVDNVFQKLEFNPIGVPLGVPRDIGDVDGDGLFELLVGAGDITLLLEQETAGSMPDKLKWSSQQDFWGGRFYDIDEDNNDEIFAHLNGTWGLYDYFEDEMVLLSEFPNNTPGTNSVGVPHIEIGDLDGDGNIEILYGDFEGDLIIYEKSGLNTWTNTWNKRLLGKDAIDFISIGNYLNKTSLNFLAATRIEDNFLSNGDSNAYWLIRVFESTSDNNFTLVDSVYISGAQSPASFESSFNSGDIDNDGIDEMIFSVYPDLYIFKMDAFSRKIKFSNVFKSSRSFRTVIGDLNNNGTQDLLYDTGNGINSIEFLSDEVKPDPVVALRVQPLSISSISILWEYAGDFDYFTVYRGANKENLLKLSDITGFSLIDTTVIKDTVYWYSVTAVNKDLPISESSFSELLSGVPNESPRVIGLTLIKPNILKIKYNEKMNKSAVNLANYSTMPSLKFSSAVFLPGNKLVLLNITGDMIPGAYKLITGKNITDVLNTPIDPLHVSFGFTIKENEKILIIKSIKHLGKQDLELEFSIDVDQKFAGDVSNYTVEPDFTVQGVTRINDNKYTLSLSGVRPIGALGFPYIIKIKKLESISGDQLVFDLDFAFTISNEDISKVFTYPNPVSLGNTGKNSMTFANLPENSKIYILDSYGRVIKFIEETNHSGGIKWDLLTDKGNLISSGIYFYVVKNGTVEVKRKFAVVK